MRMLTTRTLPSVLTRQVRGNVLSERGLSLVCAGILAVPGIRNSSPTILAADGHW